MTAFASVAFLQTNKSEELALTAFQTFFITCGLRKMVIIDDASQNKGMLLAMCEILQIQVYPVTKQNHKAISC